MSSDHHQESPVNWWSEAPLSLVGANSLNSSGSSGGLSDLRKEEDREYHDLLPGSCQNHWVLVEPKMEVPEVKELQSREAEDLVWQEFFIFRMTEFRDAVENHIFFGLGLSGSIGDVALEVRKGNVHQFAQSYVGIIKHFP